MTGSTACRRKVSHCRRGAFLPYFGAWCAAVALDSVAKLCYYSVLASCTVWYHWEPAQFSRCKIQAQCALRDVPLSSHSCVLYRASSMPANAAELSRLCVCVLVVPLSFASAGFNSAENFQQLAANRSLPKTFKRTTQPGSKNLVKIWFQDGQIDRRNDRGSYQSFWYEQRQEAQLLVSWTTIYIF